MGLKAAQMSASIRPDRMEHDARATDWHPDSLSDRQVVEAHRTVMRLRRLGGAFADLELSPAMKQRMEALHHGHPDQYTTTD